MDIKTESTGETTFGGRLATLRDKMNLTQRELAKRVRVSQATISRLESLPEPPPDILLLSKLARNLDTGLQDLAPGIELRQLGSDPEQDEEAFFTFCPNPLCRRNKYDLVNGEPMVYWNSWEGFPVNQYSEINYCGRCGTELVKECPNCQKRLGRKWAPYCVRCGERVSDRPNDKDWEQIRAALQEKASEPAPDSSGEEIPF